MADNNDTREFLGVKHYAEILGVSTRTIGMFITSGALRAVDVRRPGAEQPRYRISADEWALFMESRMTSLPIDAATPTEDVDYIRG